MIESTGEEAGIQKNIQNTTETAVQRAHPASHDLHSDPQEVKLEARNVLHLYKHTINTDLYCELTGMTSLEQMAGLSSGAAIHLHLLVFQVFQGVLKGLIKEAEPPLSAPQQ